MSGSVPAGCPFCGATPHRGKGKGALCQLHGERLQDFSFWCPHGCAKITRSSEIGALSAWNTRATPTPPIEGRDADVDPENTPLGLAIRVAGMILRNNLTVEDEREAKAILAALQALGERG